MEKIGAYVVLLVVLASVAYGLVKKIEPFDCFLQGGREGLLCCARLAPTLVALVVAVSLLSSSGLLDFVGALLAPIAEKSGLPVNVLPLALVRPFSGSGALAMYEQILVQHGADSYTGQIASAIMGSSETTFYAVSVYFGCVGISKTKNTIFCALIADTTCFVMAAFVVNFVARF